MKEGTLRRAILWSLKPHASSHGKPTKSPLPSKPPWNQKKNQNQNHRSMKSSNTFNLSTMKSRRKSALHSHLFSSKSAYDFYFRQTKHSYSSSATSLKQSDQPLSLNYPYGAGSRQHFHNKSSGYFGRRLPSEAEAEADYKRHSYKDWQDQRQWRLTASTFAAALGYFKGRRVELWKEKIGAIEPFSGSPPTYWSNLHDHLALARYQEMTGFTVQLTSLHIHQRYPWLAASPDGLLDYDALGPLAEPGVLEIKCPYFKGEANSSHPWYTFPPCYMPQAQGLMEILDRNWADFYCWTPNGSSIFRIDRDPEYWELLMSGLSEFWLGHVQPARIMRAVYPEDIYMELKPTWRSKLLPIIRERSEDLAVQLKPIVREIHGILIE